MSYRKLSEVMSPSNLGPRVPLEVSLGMPFDPTEADSDLPDIDDRLVEPGTRYEMYDGDEREQVLCERERDHARLEHWLVRAASCTTAAELFFAR
jgi:hypothetical protein